MNETKRGKLFARRSYFVAVIFALACSGSISNVSAQSGAPSDENAPPVQLVQPTTPGQSPPIIVTLQDALERARKNDAQYLASSLDAKSAHEDHLQARNALLPTVSESTQFLGTQGNGKTPEGRFVTQDGVHVYREWAVIHEDISPTAYMLTGYRHADALEAIAKAKVEIAKRGLVVTVTKNYYAFTVAQRKYAVAQQALDQSKRFFDITQEGEKGGQTAHADVIKAEILFNQQEQAFDEASLEMENARLDLAVLLFPTMNENFSVVDDLDSPQTLPPFPEIESMAERENPNLRMAKENAAAADLDVSAAKGSFLPSLTIDADYGIEANDFSLHAVPKAHSDLGYLPTMGYFVTASLNIPVWDWGTLRSKLHQAEYKQEQSRAELNQAQRQILRDLYSSYNEASVARSSVEGTRHTADLATESLRLINLRYQAGESSALEVVDAQTTLTLARGAYADAQMRYRLALANLQTITGSF